MGLLVRSLLGIGLVALALWLGNTSVFVTGVESGKTRLIAHRGVHQTYIGTDRSNDSCHAAPVTPITHGFVENTLPSMAEAFRLGADVVELDVHLLREGQFAVFHDWTLDCRTDGAGVTRKQDLATLQALDVAFRIDDGSGRFALRGTGRGALPTLSQVFDAGAGALLVNFKSRDAAEGAALAGMLSDPANRAQVFGVYGGGPPTWAAVNAVEGLRGYDKASVKSCLMRYLASGWSGFVPRVCRNALLPVPISHARLMWGWPHRFTQRMARAGTDVILLGPYDGSGFSSGIDDADTLARVPEHFDGYLWTDRIEVIGPLLRDR